MAYSNSEIDVLNNLITYLEKSDSGIRQIEDIVPIDEWINDSYYTGKNTLYPYWKDTIVEVFQNEIHEYIATGSIRGGKTYSADFMALRWLYMHNCFSVPQAQYDIAPTSLISFWLMSRTKEQGELTGFGELKSIIDASPYFNEHMKRNRKSSMIEFKDKKISVLCGSDEGDFIGSSMFLVILDEANFLRASGGMDKFRKAESIYMKSANRIQYTFTKDRKRYGMTMILSSSDTQSSFTEKRIEEVSGKPGVLIKRATKFDIKPEDYSSRRFWVFTGSKNTSPFIVKPDNREKYMDLIVSNNIIDFNRYVDFYDMREVEIPEIIKDKFCSIPEDFYDNFEQDVENSLKEIAGIAIASESKFFSDYNAYQQCIDSSMIHPFRSEFATCTTGTSDNELIQLLNDDFYGNPKIKYKGHQDLSFTKDSSTIVIGHEENGIAIIDLQIMIHPPKKPHEIKLDKIRDFIYYLKTVRRFNIVEFSVDGWQSGPSRQFYDDMGIKSYVFSLDKNDEPFTFAKMKIMAGEVRFYNYPRLEFELFSLTHDNEKRKVDHPPQNGRHAKDGGYGDDLAEGFCATVCHVLDFGQYRDKINENKRDVIKRYARNRMNQMGNMSVESIMQMENRKLAKEKYGISLEKLKKSGVKPIEFKKFNGF